MRVLILSQYYAPEPVPKPSELASALRLRGHEVSVLTGYPNYPSGDLYEGFRLRPMERTVMDGVPVIRAFEYPYHGTRAIGRMLKEHEATVSRHLTRTRRELRERVESELRRAHAMDDAAVAECFRAVSADAGPLDLRELLGPAVTPAAAPAGRKDPRPGRSNT